MVAASRIRGDFTPGRHIMKITWYGHAAFRLDFAGKAVLIDPFFTGNPVFVSDKAEAIKDVSHIVLTHGHGDHVGDTLDIAKTNGATVTANYDLGMWLVSKGLEKLNPMNTGGTTDLSGFTVSMVRADHSSGDRADRRPLHHGCRNRGVSGETLLQARRCYSLPLRHVSFPGSDPRQVRRRHERPRHQSHRSGKGPAVQRLDQLAQPRPKKAAPA
jgi:Metallo-beta-lactamase superfamily